MNNNQLIHQHLKYKFIYSMMGLVLGLTSILSGSYLLLSGVTGATNFSAMIFGNETKLTDATPGTILFIIGLFLVITTRYTKIKIPTSEGGSFYGAPSDVNPSDTPHENNNQSDTNLIKIFTKLLETIDQCQPNYHLVEFISGILRHPKYSHDKLSWVIDTMRTSNTYEKFVLKSIQNLYSSDDSRLIRGVCGSLRGHLPQTEQIKELLLKGIFDTTKSNKLRESFWWIFSYDYKQSAKDFYMNDLDRFFKENENNENLCAEIIDDLHWIINSNSKELKHIKNIMNNYINNHNSVRSIISSSFTKELLNIA